MRRNANLVGIPTAVLFVRALAAPPQAVALAPAAKPINDNRDIRPVLSNNCRLTDVTGNVVKGGMA